MSQTARELPTPHDQITARSERRMCTSAIDSCRLVVRVGAPENVGVLSEEWHPLADFEGHVGDFDLG
jgi:hypothetical protein